MNAEKNTHGGARPGSGRKPSGDPTKKFSIAARMSEYTVLKDAAEKAGKTISRFVVEAALEKAHG